MHLLRPERRAGRGRQHTFRPRSDRRLGRPGNRRLRRSGAGTTGVSRTPLLSWRGAVIGIAAGLYAAVFGIRAAELVDVEAADSLLAAPIALVAMAFGVSGGIVAGLVAAAAFAGAEA